LVLRGINEEGQNRYKREGDDFDDFVSKLLFFDLIIACDTDIHDSFGCLHRLAVATAEILTALPALTSGIDIEERPKLHLFKGQLTILIGLYGGLLAGSTNTANIFDSGNTLAWSEDITCPLTDLAGIAVIINLKGFFGTEHDGRSVDSIQIGFRFVVVGFRREVRRRDYLAGAGNVGQVWWLGLSRK
jgi:hypothetical protein